MLIRAVNRLVLVLAIAASAIAVPAMLDAQFPTRPPAPLPLEAAPFPPFVDTLLSNNVRIVVVNKPTQPVLSLTLAVPAGSYFDPLGKIGVADFTAQMLTKGAGRRTAEEISAAIEGVGGAISSSAGSDFLTVSVSVLSSDKQLAFDLLADAVLRPTFPENELELLRTQTLSALELQRSQPDAIASRSFARALYGDHPYARRPVPSTVRALTRNDLVDFHRTHVKPNQALLVVAGDMDGVEAQELAEAAFGRWGGVNPSPPAARPAPQRARTEIIVVHRSGSVQSNIIAGNTTWMPSDTRGFGLTIANQILGGASDSRLFQLLREEKGWTYGAYSGVARSRFLGSFSATAEVRTEVTDSAVVELLRQMHRMSTELVPEDEFERQKQTLVGRFPLQVETAAQIASQVANARLLGLPVDYVQTYRQRLAAVTREQVQTAARSGIRAEAALVVVVGDATKIARELNEIAPVTVVDQDGGPVSMADLVVTAQTLDWDRSRLAPSADSFAVMVQGNEFGHQTIQLSRDGAGWVINESSTLGPMISQSSEVRMSADLAMLSLAQTGKFQGQDIYLNVAYENGAARGEGRSPGPAGIQEINYSDVATPEGTIDDNALNALLPYFKWSANTTISLGVFATGKGTIERRMLSVVGEETVTVPAGTFTAYRVSYTGGEAPGTYWIEAAPPHRLLKFGPSGVPVEFVRAR